MTSALHSPLLFLTALISVVTLGLMPLPADSAPETWIDQIALQIMEQQENTNGESSRQAYSRYLVQLQKVREALARGSDQTVQAEMNRLINMLGAKEGQISDSSAITLLLAVGELTPSKYLDYRAANHLRLIMDRVDDSANDAYAEMQSGWNILAAKRADWGLGPIRMTTSGPIVALGTGVLLLVLVGAGILLLLALRDRSTGDAVPPERRKRAA